MKDNAEFEYRKAFRRIVEGKALRVGKMAPPNLANIAREAGKDPSALKKSRYPIFISEVESFNNNVNSAGERIDRSLSTQLKAARSENKKLRESYEQLTIERDESHSRVLNLQLALVEMSFGVDGVEKPSSIANFDLYARQKLMRNIGKDKF
ncbi:hypothetical protein TZ03_11455 [Pseudomonas sp. 10-1B]|uniref:hypothetical protein n=1 Tax=Pseudomonas sp. 10-1B TaxID=1546029 RepID=UPI00061F142F|nr:hypothetical protein [Pseudomonas sp. 10-1B]KIY40750.1 hypothetical protein TZ03_11455 [Pseudomonas sp. 10-1B]